MASLPPSRLVSNKLIMLIVRKRILALSRNYFRFCSFYTQKSATMQYQNEFKTRTDATGKLVPVGDTSVIAEVNDKYGLEQIRDPAKMYSPKSP